MKVSQPTQVTYGRIEDTEVAETRTKARAAHIAATIVLSLETVETVPLHRPDQRSAVTWRSVMWTGHRFPAV